MSTSERLLDDAGMRHFIVKGYHSFKLDFPPDFHVSIHSRTEELFAARGNPGNNLLPLIPELQQILDHPRVHGTLASILGPEYCTHPHRHCHLNPPGSEGQILHKDARSTCHHRTRDAMVMYYPQDVTEDMGPTGVVPESQYHHTSLDGPLGPERPMCGEAGTVTILHYDLWHRAMPNRSTKKRFMMKFLFTRLEEPNDPSWDSTAAEWPSMKDGRRTMWESMWRWYRGGQDCPPGEVVPQDALPVQMGLLQDKSEAVRLQAAYALGSMGAPALPGLVEALQAESEEVRLSASHALCAMGEPAVDALIEASRDPREETRVQAVDTLGNMGRKAQKSVDALARALNDPSVEVRRRSAGALGTMNGAAAAALPALIRALGDEDSSVRGSISLTLARMGHAAGDALPELIDALSDENWYVRGNVLETLARIGTPEAHEILLKFLRTSRWCPLDAGG